jgi:hypothetical protein
MTEPLLTTYLAMHASFPAHSLRLIRIVELVLVIRTDLANGSLDWLRLEQLLDRTRLWRFVFPAFELAERLVPGLLDGAFRRKLAAQATSVARRVVSKISANGWQGWTDRQMSEHLMWFQGSVEFMLNISELVWPGGIPARAILPLHVKRWRMVLRSR